MLAPPLKLEQRWLAPHLPYSLAKFGMSLCVLGLSGELRAKGIAVNALWPRTIIGTAALKIAMQGAPAEALRRVRLPQVVADAAYAILNRGRDFTGNFCIDEQMRREEGVTDFSPYRGPAVREEELLTDLFV